MCGLPEEGAHEKSPKCLGGNLGDFGEFCKGLGPFTTYRQPIWRNWLFTQTEVNYYNNRKENQKHRVGALLRIEALF
ncbi:hypothetical protein HMPREF1051_0323 [Neisseria sicca VK64]|uniref:Uncharacterized protein n=1 Tax=Neisseria sicca VK64 TaxID=1095748 RepID=I2NVT4_NEISI|nr:hypothetical protein HMPREF1051_0323 [Neisseria sicca VK64]